MEDEGVTNREKTEGWGIGGLRGCTEPMRWKQGREKARRTKSFTPRIEYWSLRKQVEFRQLWVMSRSIAEVKWR